MKSFSSERVFFWKENKKKAKENKKRLNKKGYFFFFSFPMALNAALDLMRRLPPRDIEKNLENTLALAPEVVEDLLSAVDQVCLSFSLLCELS